MYDLLLRHEYFISIIIIDKHSRLFKGKRDINFKSATFRCLHEIIFKRQKKLKVTNLYKFEVIGLS